MQNLNLTLAIPADDQAPRRRALIGSLLLAAAIVVLLAGDWSTAGRLAGEWSGGAWSRGALLALGTLISEDIACVTAGHLVKHGSLNAFAAVMGCFVGIYLGDMGLYFSGRLVRTRFGRFRNRAWMDRIEQTLEGQLPQAIFASRVIPGTRLPLYFAAGALRVPVKPFALYTLIACALWTPLLVLSSAGLAHGLNWLAGDGRFPIAFGAVGTLLLLNFARMLARPFGRARFVATYSKLWRWEFWPAWIFYIPVVVWTLILSIRYRGFTTITAANSGIPHGGFVGESKAQILSQIDSGYVLPYALIDAGEVHPRAEFLARIMCERRWSFPLVLKPDVGQRGAGVKLVHSIQEAIESLRSPFPMIAQVYHPGPFEAGVFYYRIPGESVGHIFSITDKHFPEIEGDGASTLEQLLWKHPRFRMQAPTFLRRHHAQRDRVLAAGERMRLAIAGNHCQGTLFRDGRHLITPALELAIDRIAKTFDGFYFGRFDIRYSDVEAFKDGKDFAVIELNGITAEATDLYDPSNSLLSAYRTLLRQWSILFRIGHVNRKVGIRSSSLRSLCRDTLSYYRAPRPSSLAD